jgi:hypothetical protein
MIILLFFSLDFFVHLAFQPLPVIVVQQVLFFHPFPQFLEPVESFVFDSQAQNSDF